MEIDVIKKDANPVADTLGIYVHIPFCVRKCNYCDFCSVSGSSKKMQEYVRHLVREIEDFEKVGAKTADTLFFGGGTPSVLSIDNFLSIVNSLKKRFRISPSAEFTVEVNPGTVTEEKLRAYRLAGVNRLSIGMQSIHENELKKLGRIHDYADFLEAYTTARRVGFDNINVDIMYGIPEQTKESFEQTLQRVVALSPEHISCYGLIIEEGTPFCDNRQELSLPDEDEEISMYNLAASVLGAAGYSHYEISNYAKDGFRCRHNLKYWNCEDYIGFGISAHSYLLGKRFYNTSVFEEYFTDEVAKYRYDENAFAGLDPDEYVMLRLRLSEGVLFDEYKRLFGESFFCGREALLEKFSSAGLARLTDSSFALTERGFYLSNSIITELI